MEKAKAERKRHMNNYGAMEKCRAVLAIWTERRRPAEICRELQVPWMVLAHWQKRAMEGMLQALEPRVRLDKGPALSPRLQTMLDKKRVQLMSMNVRLEKTLSRAQETRKAEKTQSDSNPTEEALRKPEKP